MTLLLPPTAHVDLDAPLRDYFLTRVRQSVHDVYAGVPISKFPEDLRVYEHLLWLAAPNTVIELGTQHGGSALWFRDRLRTLVAHGRIDSAHVISVDIDQSSARDALDGEFGITLIEGALEDAAVLERVGRHAGNARCLVVEDTAHTYETTTAALHGYAQFVPIGGYMVIEDGCVDDDRLRLCDDWPRGVRPALEAWLPAAGRTFAVRRDLELYGVSCHPGGFLQRVGWDGT